MSTIKVEDIAHVRFSVPDLGEMKSFLDDFGLVTVQNGDTLYSRAAGTAPFVHAASKGDPGFAALGLRAESEADLAILAEAEGVEVEVLDAPGGGSVVRLTDPDGILVEVVTGQTLVEPLQTRSRPPANTIASRPRNSETVRLEQGPSNVVRLGHCALAVTDHAASIKWYGEKLGFLVSDEIELAPDMPIGAFMRCDRGDTPTDHHTLFLVQPPEGSGFNHAAYEVVDMDDLMLGHEHLKSKERRQEWGIGRHILGSQIFDYWRDPWGHTLEHWTDGDLFTASDPSKKAGVDQLAGVQWGQPIPPTFG